MGRADARAPLDAVPDEVVAQLSLHYLLRFHHREASRRFDAQEAVLGQLADAGSRVGGSYAHGKLRQRRLGVRSSPQDGTQQGAGRFAQHRAPLGRPPLLSAGSYPPRRVR